MRWLRDFFLYLSVSGVLLAPAWVASHDPHTCSLHNLRAEHSSCAIRIETPPTSKLSYIPFLPTKFPESGIMKLTDTQKREFIENGYILLPESLPTDLIDTAEAFCDEAYANKRYNRNMGAKLGSSQPAASFHKPVRQSHEITDLFYKTWLEELANDLLDGHAVLRESLGQIAYTPLSDKAKEEGMSVHKTHPRWGWHIDAGHGKYKDLGSDFSFLIGVALSEGQEVDENRGQFTLFPGSHVITHEAMRQLVLDGAEDIMETFKKNRPKLGEPIRALLARGHVMIAHQRLAHAPGVNLSDVTRKNIYFRVVHDQHDDLVRIHSVAPSPWTGFYGLREFLPEGAVDGA